MHDPPVAALMLAARTLLPSAPLEADHRAINEEPFEHALVRLYLAALRAMGHLRPAARFHAGVQRSWW